MTNESTLEWLSKPTRPALVARAAILWMLLVGGLIIWLSAHGHEGVRPFAPCSLGLC